MTVDQHGRPLKPRPAKCVDCGATKPHVTTTPDGGQVWLCGSCEFKRLHPDAAPALKMPWERRAKRKQKEQLF